MQYSRVTRRNVEYYADAGPDSTAGGQEGAEGVERAAADIQRSNADLRTSLENLSWQVAQAEDKYEAASTPSEKAWAAERLALTREVAAAGARTAASLAMFSLTLKMARLGQEVGNAIFEAQSRREEQGEYLRALLEDSLSAEIHRRSVAGHYYVRSIRKDRRGWGFLLVDLRDGRWREVLGSPDQYYYSSGDLLNIPIPAGAGNTLFVNGVGLDAASWQPLVANVITKVAGPSLLAYDLARIPLLDPRFYDRCGYLDTRGNPAFPARLDFAGPFAGGAAPVCRDGRWGSVGAGGAVTWGRDPPAPRPGRRPPARFPPSLPRKRSTRSGTRRRDGTGTSMPRGPSSSPSASRTPGASPRGSRP